VTTIAQVRQVTGPLLERNADLALVGRLVVIKPVRHLIRGIFFGRGADPVVFQPTWFVNFLFKPDAGVSETWGERLYTKKRIKLDSTKRATLAQTRIMLAQMRLPVRERRYPKSWGGWVAYDPKTATELCDTIERQALPMLRGIQSIDDFIAFTSDQARFPWTFLGSNYFNEPFVYAARGDFETALAICKKLPTRDSTAAQINELLPRLADGDRNGVEKLLRDWEASSIERLKLEKFWERAPFPIEAAT
jgi:hypothetical protein